MLFFIILKIVFRFVLIDLALKKTTWNDCQTSKKWQDLSKLWFLCNCYTLHYSNIKSLVICIINECTYILKRAEHCLKH